jgi:hypothetical protein
MRTWLSIPIWICASAAALADQLTLQDQSFVASAIGNVVVMHECPGFEHVPGALMRHADAAGADVARIAPAIDQAMRLGAGMDYDPSKVIPEVTRFLNETADTLTNDEQKRGKAAFCKKWTDFFVEQGLIRPK